MDPTSNIKQFKVLSNSPSFHARYKWKPKIVLMIISIALAFFLFFVLRGFEQTDDVYGPLRILFFVLTAVAGFRVLSVLFSALEYSDFKVESGQFMVSQQPLPFLHGCTVNLSDIDELTVKALRRSRGNGIYGYQLQMVVAGRPRILIMEHGSQDEIEKIRAIIQKAVG